MPSVTTSNRVLSDTFVSKRTRYPTVSPTASPSSEAILTAIWRAAIRRGSSITTFPFPLISRMARGRTVDFPAPGGADTTRRGQDSSDEFTLAAISRAGSFSPAAVSIFKKSFFPLSVIFIMIIHKVARSLNTLYIK